MGLWWRALLLQMWSPGQQQKASPESGPAFKQDPRVTPARVQV